MATEAGRYATLLEGFKATLLQTDPEPYDVSALIRRRQAQQNLKETRRHLLRATLRNVRTEAPRG